MNLIFVHGWSVHSHKTYAKLPLVIQKQAQQLGIEINTIDLKLARYISFDDSIEMRDITRAFHQAIAEQIPDNSDRSQPFACITHSTGSPVVRAWMDEFYGKDQQKKVPLTHLITLAPANHGSALAQIGKGRLGRIKAAFEGIQPGIKILDWLELGSTGQRDLNYHYLDYQSPSYGNPFLFTITGQYIDAKLYDHLNSYTGEPGSDGVVRVAAANMNFRKVVLAQSEETYDVVDFQDRKKRRYPHKLKIQLPVQHSPATAHRIVADSSHSGDKHGIMGSVQKINQVHRPVVAPILEALQVSKRAEYNQLVKTWKIQSDEQQELDRASDHKPTGAYSMIVFSIWDHEDQPMDDFDIYLLSGNDYDPDQLPKGFFQDRQKNSLRCNTITYYLNHDKLSDICDKKIGFLVRARRNRGFVYFNDAEWHSDDLDLEDILEANQTLYLDIHLTRNVDIETTRLDPMTKLGKSFKKTKPSGTCCP